MGPGPNYSCTRVLLYTKMLKETENEETRLFCPIFIISGISIGRGPLPLAPLPGYVYDCNFNAICDIKILNAFLLVCHCVNVKATLKVLFCVMMLNM